MDNSLLKIPVAHYRARFLALNWPLGSAGARFGAISGRAMRLVWRLCRASSGEKKRAAVTDSVPNGTIGVKGAK